MKKSGEKSKDFKAFPVFFLVLRLILVAAAIIILITSLYLNDTIGLSDNGDFKRVISPNRITYGEEGREEFVFTDTFELQFEGSDEFERIYNSIFTLEQPYATTQHVFIKASILLNLIYNSLTGEDLSVYKIQWLGVLYCIFLTLTLGMIFRNVRFEPKWLNIAFFILLIFVFCDTAYTAYFNSFYGEALQFTSFLFVFACAASIIFSYKKRVLYHVLYYLGVILFMGSKFANIPLGIILALAGLSFILLDKSNKLTKAVNITGLILVLAVSVFFYISIPEWMDEHTTYQAVFFGILKDSPEPGKDLKELGLPSYMIALQNTNYYMQGHKVDIHSSKFRRDFYDNISKYDVLLFYLKKPLRLWEKLYISVKNSAHIQPVYLSNYGKEHERLKRCEKFNTWSSLRPKLPLDNIYFIMTLFILATLFIVLEIFLEFKKPEIKDGNKDDTRAGKVQSNNKDKNINKYKNINNNGKYIDHKKTVAGILCLALLIINGINMCVPVISNGEADIAKHMFGFVTGIDLMLLIMVTWVLSKFPCIFNNIKNIYNKIKIKNTSKPGSFNQVMPLLLFTIFILICLSSVILISMYNTRSDGFKSLSEGAYVSFGEYNGNKLLWKVINTGKEGILLFADEVVEFMAFDSEPKEGDKNRIKHGSNYWPDSSLRKWLNGEFLKDFSDNEIELINNYKNKVLLSIHDKEMSEGGDNNFFWTHVPLFASFGFDDAYHMYVNDKVFLLDVKQLVEFLTKKGIPIRRNYSYWLETAYFSNSSMVRIVDKDGYIYMRDANVNHIGVIPAFYLKTDVTIVDGDGTRENPFKVKGKNGVGSPR